MRKLLLLLVIILLTASLGYSQAYVWQPKDGKKTYAGFKIGINLANFHGDDADEFESERRKGYCAGIVVRHQISPVMFFQPELLYSEKGCEKDYASTAKYEYNLKYIEMPLLLKVNFIGREKASAGILLGPVISYSTSAEIRVKYETHTTERNIEKNIKDLDFGLAGGVSFDYETIGNLIQVEILYTYGLHEFDDTEGNVKDYKNSCITFSLGMLF